ncbi:MAG: hypothetical protein R3336_10160, partial [Phycisphaeraceae bacterium]|nr:hypothetical protein [Phycisphaeraceae bacterium]
YYAGALPVNEDNPIVPQLMLFIASGYLFKFTVALLDTGPAYLGVYWLGRYLRIDPSAEHAADEEEVALAVPLPGERLSDVAADE